MLQKSSYRKFREKVFQLSSSLQRNCPTLKTSAFKTNFVDYYQDFVDKNSRKGNRHLANSFTQFKLFINSDFIAPIDITENFCKRFRQHLLDKYTGQTPLNYFSRFKWVVNAAESDGYFHKKPTEKVFAKANPSVKLKDNLEVEEYLSLILLVLMKK